MTLVAFIVGLAFGLLGGLGFGAWVCHNLTYENEELRRRLSERDKPAQESQPSCVDPGPKRQLMLITSNVRNSAQRGK